LALSPTSHPDQAIVSNMATEVPPVVLSSEVREMINENFYQALESIRNIYAPLKLADKDKANRLAKLSNELSQIQREAHLAEIISPLSPIDAIFESDAFQGPGGDAEPGAAPQAIDAGPDIARPLDITVGRTRDQSTVIETARTVISPPTPQANAEQPLTAQNADSIDLTEIQKANTDEDETTTSKEIAGGRIEAGKGRGKQLVIADEPTASGIKSVEEGSMDVPVQQNPDTTVNQTQSQKVQRAKDNKPDWAKTAWARFAAEESEENGKEVAADEKPAASGDNGVEEGNTSAPEKLPSNEKTVEMLRVVEVHGLPRTWTLRDVTREITEGPLMHVGLQDAPNDTKHALLIFLRADDAMNFLTKNVEIMLKMGATQSCYGPGVSVDLAGPRPDDEWVPQMTGKGAVRRRLTFSRKGLFTKVAPSQFYHDIADIVGGGWNIELVWLFNAGNGTVVFGNITDAVQALEWFKAKAGRSGPYSGVTVSYSSDPCEAVLHLVSQMPGGGEVRT